MGKVPVARENMPHGKTERSKVGGTQISRKNIGARLDVAAHSINFCFHSKKKWGDFKEF